MGKGRNLQTTKGQNKTENKTDEPCKDNALRMSKQQHSNLIQCVSQ